MTGEVGEEMKDPVCLRLGSGKEAVEMLSWSTMDSYLLISYEGCRI